MLRTDLMMRKEGLGKEMDPIVGEKSSGIDKSC